VKPDIVLVVLLDTVLPDIPLLYFISRNW